VPTGITTALSIALVGEIYNRKTKIKRLNEANNMTHILGRIKYYNSISLTFIFIFVLRVICLMSYELYITVFRQNVFANIKNGDMAMLLLRLFEYFEVLDSCGTFPMLILASPFFRRLLYQVSCRRRANLGAILLQGMTARRNIVQKRLDPLAKTHRKQIFALRFRRQEIDKCKISTIDPISLDPDYLAHSTIGDTTDDLRKLSVNKDTFPDSPSVQQIDRKLMLPTSAVLLETAMRLKKFRNK
jgi:hypothetical protein